MPTVRLPIRVPPLRDRRGDIPALVEALADDIALRNGQALPELTPEALAVLCAQNWRGNIRELRNVLEQTAMRSDARLVDGAALEQLLREAGVEHITPASAVAAGDAKLPPAAPRDHLRPLSVQVAELERAAIEAAMAATKGNKLAAARLLGIARATLYERLGNSV